MARETREQLAADNEQLITEAEEGRKARIWMANRIVVLENKVRELEDQIRWLRPPGPSPLLRAGKVEPLPSIKPW